jgi:uncharacterized protein YjbI with pentapeptide repeats
MYKKAFSTRYPKLQNQQSRSQSTIQGVAMRKANLMGASFIENYAGLTRFQVVFQVLLISLLTYLVGILSVYAAIWSTALLKPRSILDYTAVPGIVVVAIALITLGVVFRKGFAFSIGIGLSIIAVFGILTVLFQTTLMGTILLNTVVTVILELVVLWLSGLAVAASQSHATVLFASLSVTCLWGVITTLINQPTNTGHIDGFDIVICVSILFTGGLIGWNIFSLNSPFTGIVSCAIYLSAIGGTSFQQANLTEADFSRAVLKHTDFRNADLTRTCWHNARGLEFARLGSTYLANPKIRQLVVTCNGQGQNFDGLDLTGVNLEDAKLQDASFIGVKLNQSNLRGANLSRATLKQTQLDGTDLTGAILTGAYIEDWGITSTTKLENVQCEYVYMRVPTKENPNPLRKPDSLRETFAEGEFADFIQPFFDTLDLYHSQNVDPRAISIALRDLSANHPDDNVQFVAIERRGNTGLNLRFTTTPGANKSELSHEYFSSYAQIKKELPIAAQIKLAEQDAKIQTLKGTIEQFIQTGTHRSTIQAETIQVIQGEIVMTENRGININAGDNANVSGLASGDGVVNLGTISGNVTNAINQLPNPSESEQPDLKVLLTQLQQAIETDTNLPDPDKSDLLEQVQALAEAKQTEEPTKREGITRKAMKMFNATLKSLPDTAKIVEACSKLLPLILKALGSPI